MPILVPEACLLLWDGPCSFLHPADCPPALPPAVGPAAADKPLLVPSYTGPSAVYISLLLCICFRPWCLSWSW